MIEAQLAVGRPIEPIGCIELVMSNLTRLVDILKFYVTNSVLNLAQKLDIFLSYFEVRHFLRKNRFWLPTYLHIWVTTSGADPIKKIYSVNLCYTGSECSDWLKILE